jgi:hypothetical protein
MDALKKFFASVIDHLIPAGEIRFNIKEKEGYEDRKFIDAVPDYNGEFGAVEAVEEIRQRADDMRQLLPMSKFLIAEYGMMKYIFRGPKVIDLARRVVLSTLDSSVQSVSMEYHCAAVKILKFAADQKDLDQPINQTRLKIDYRARQISLSEAAAVSKTYVEIVSFEDVRDLAGTVLSQFSQMERSMAVDAIVSRHIRGWRDGDVVEQLDDVMIHTPFQEAMEENASLVFG